MVALTRVGITLIYLLMGYFLLGFVWRHNVDVTWWFRNKAEGYAKDAVAPEPQRISARIEHSSSPAWFVQNGVVYQVYVSWMILLRNEGPDPLLIVSNVLEQQRPDGTWETASLPWGTKGRLFTGPEDRTRVAEWRYDTLDSALANKNLAVKETARGYVFQSKPVTGRMRLRVIDSLGNSYYSESLGMIPIAGPIGQASGMESLNHFEDISSLPLATDG